MTHPNQLMKDFGKAFKPRKPSSPSITPQEVARKILAFDPGNDTLFIAVGINEPLQPSTTGLTWQHIRALARAALPKGEKPPKKRLAAKRVKLTPA